MTLAMFVIDQSYHAEQSQQTGPDAQHRVPRPAAGGLEPQVGTRFLKGGLDRPAAGKQADDGRGVELGAGGVEVLVAAAAAVADAAVGGIAASGVSTKVAIHGAHHSFGAAGRLSHIQINWWRAGVKGSGGVIRIPLPWR